MQRRNFIAGISGILVSSQAPAILAQGTAMKLWRPEKIVVPSQIDQFSRLLALWAGWELVVANGLVGMEKNSKRIWVNDSRELLDEKMVAFGNCLVRGPMFPYPSNTRLPASYHSSQHGISKALVERVG